MTIFSERAILGGKRVSFRRFTLILFRHITRSGTLRPLDLLHLDTHLHGQAIVVQPHTQSGHIACGALVLREPGANDPSRGVVDIGVEGGISLALAEPLELRGIFQKKLFIPSLDTAQRP